MRTLGQDLRFGIRLLLRNPAFTAVAVLTLALGIGANSAIFSVVHAVLLKPLPYAEPDRLAMLWMDNRRQALKEDLTSYPNYEDWKRGGTNFVDMAAFSPQDFALTGIDEPERVRGVLVSANFFPVLGVSPALGRTITEDEAREDRPVVVISDGLWRRRFGASRDVIGKDIEIGNRMRQVIGVMPAEYRFPAKGTDIWAPLSVPPGARNARFGFWLSVVGRMKPGVTVEQARAEMDAVAKRLEAQFPEMAGFGVTVNPLDRQIAGDTRTPILVLAAAVAFVLLIACANVANLFLARAQGREREIAIRAALGAGRGRVIRQLLTESTLLAVVAGLLATAVSAWGVRVLVALAPEDLPRLDEIRVDPLVIAFTMGVAILTGLLFGLAPAWRISKTELIDPLREGGRALAGGIRGRRTRAALVVAEFAMAVILLAGAGLMIRTMLQLANVDPGFHTDRVLTLRLSVSRARFPEGPQVTAFFQQLMDRLAAVPGVQSAGAIGTLLLSSTPNSGNFTVEGHPPIPPEQQIEATVDAITPGFFSAMGVRLLKGRFFTAADGPQSTPVVIINETMAKRFWPNADAVGKRFKFGGPQSRAPWLTVTGVVADMRRQGLHRVARSETFMPHSQRPGRGLEVLVRTSGDPKAMLSTVRSEIRAAERTALVFGEGTLAEVLGDSLSYRRFQTLLLGLFSALALSLAAVGIYGVMYNSVVERTHEIGVRVALGAGTRDVLRMVVGEGVLLAAVGIVIGFVGAFALTRAMSMLLYNVSATDPLTFAASGVVLAAIAIAASYIPARRASRVDPAIALRYE